jgi:hypothetical protein
LVKDKVRRLWKNDYNAMSDSTSSSSNGVTTTKSLLHEEPESLLEWGRNPKWRRLETSGSVDDERDIYLAEPRVSIANSDYINWWMENRYRFPCLATMAFDAAAIAAMSAEVERVFSSSKLQLSDRRLALGDDIVEAQEFLKSLVHNDLLCFERAQGVLKMMDAIYHLGR